MLLPDYVLELIHCLNNHGYEAYVVGGAIRSTLLDLPVHDYDLTTNALPEEMKEIFSSYHTIETGIQHGTLTVVIHHHPIEITTYRKDSTYKDHRHPDQVEFTPSLHEDCKRRDFTINAMCYHPDTGIIDFFDGQKDLEKHIIRCIGEPERRIEEDALRILRALRFAGRLSFTIDPDTSKVLFEKKDTLQYVSIERITEEFNGILESADCAAIMLEYRSIFEVFLPELKDYSNHLYEELLSQIQNEPSHNSTIRLAILFTGLNDISLASKILKRMKVSNQTLSTVTTLLDCDSMPIDTDIAFRTVLNKLKTDIDTYLSFYISRHPQESLDTKKQQYNHLLADEYCWNLKDLACNGQDLMKLDMKGKQIGETLNHVLDLVIHEKLINNQDIILQYIQEL